MVPNPNFVDVALLDRIYSSRDATCALHQSHVEPQYGYAMLAMPCKENGELYDFTGGKEPTFENA